MLVWYELGTNDLMEKKSSARRIDTKYIEEHYFAIKKVHLSDEIYTYLVKTIPRFIIIYIIIICICLVL